MLTLVLYALLAIGLIAGLFMLAVRVLPAGEQIAPAIKDEPLWTLPEERAVRAPDVEQVRLPVALRGYRFAEVDQLLDRLAQELRERDEQIAALRDGSRRPVDVTTAGASVEATSVVQPELEWAEELQPEQEREPEPAVVPEFEPAMVAAAPAVAEPMAYAEPSAPRRRWWHRLQGTPAPDLATAGSLQLPAQRPQRVVEPAVSPSWWRVPTNRTPAVADAFPVAPPAEEVAVVDEAELAEPEVVDEAELVEPEVVDEADLVEPEVVDEVAEAAEPEVAVDEPAEPETFEPEAVAVDPSDEAAALELDSDVAVQLSDATADVGEEANDGGQSEPSAALAPATPRRGWFRRRRSAEHSYEIPMIPPPDLQPEPEPVAAGTADPSTDELLGVPADEAATEPSADTETAPDVVDAADESVPIPTEPRRRRRRSRRGEELLGSEGDGDGEAWWQHPGGLGDEQHAAVPVAPLDQVVLPADEDAEDAPAPQSDAPAAPSVRGRRRRHVPADAAADADAAVEVALPDVPAQPPVEEEPVPSPEVVPTFSEDPGGFAQLGPHPETRRERKRRERAEQLSAAEPMAVPVEQMTAETVPLPDVAAAPVDVIAEATAPEPVEPAAAVPDKETAAQAEQAPPERGRRRRRRNEPPLDVSAYLAPARGDGDQPAAVEPVADQADQPVQEVAAEDTSDVVDAAVEPVAEPAAEPPRRRRSRRAVAADTEDLPPAADTEDLSAAEPEPSLPEALQAEAEAGSVVGESAEPTVDEAAQPATPDEQPVAPVAEIAETMPLPGPPSPPPALEPHHAGQHWWRRGGRDSAPVEPPADPVLGRRATPAAEPAAPKWWQAPASQPAQPAEPQAAPIQPPEPATALGGWGGSPSVVPVSVPIPEVVAEPAPQAAPEPASEPMPMPEPEPEPEPVAEIVTAPAEDTAEDAVADDEGGETDVPPPPSPPRAVADWQPPPGFSWGSPDPPGQ